MKLEALTNGVAALQARIDGGTIVPHVTYQEIREKLAARYDFAAPIPLDTLVDDVEDMLLAWQVQVTHPRYFGLFNPSVTPASVVADVLTATFNPQLASWRTSPAANEIERHTLRWMAGKFGLPSTSTASFTTGGAEANLSAVIVALTRAFPGYGMDGLRRLPGAPTIYVSGEAHHSFTKIVHMAGLGRAALRIVSADTDLRMDVAALRERVAADRRNGLVPFLVVGTAGTTAAGAIDPLPALADFCAAEQLWFHVDAAWGGAAIISPTLRSHLGGIERADSITCDAHKWFSVPMGAGMFFCRHADAVREAFHAETSYMPTKGDVATLDPYTSSAQWSRRFIGLKLFLSLAERGESGYIDMIEHQVRIGDLLRKRLTDSGWQIVNRTPLPLVCFTRDGLDPSAFLTALYERQIAWMSQVSLSGSSLPVLRACVTSFKTTASDVESVVCEMNALVKTTAPAAHQSV